MSYNKQLLVIDDEPALRMMVRAVVEDAGWSVAEASSGEAGIDHLASHNVNVVLLDMRMTGIDGSETLAIIQEKYPNLPVIMLTAFGTVGSAVEAMKRGAFDYLSKPADNDELIAVLEKAYTHGRLLAENDNLRKKFIGNDPSEKIIGGCAAMQDMLELIRQVGPTEATVLVMGESGTGKELIAEALHERSNRAAFPMVKINCAALPGNLLESELFGYVRGAFTGAVKDKPGRFQLAKGGTIFLDEIGEMPIELQAKLLRALQERVVEPLGAVKPVEIDVRIIAATNRNLREAVAKGEFREDLYFRLNVLELISPPLRDRLDDLPLLVSRLLDKLGRKKP
jgi:two-component system, NtrC family, response regulator